MVPNKIIFSIIFAATLLVNNNLQSQNTNVNNGVLDVTQTDLSTKLIKLEGNWDFYWKEFVMPLSAADSLYSFQKYLAPLPKPWTKVVLKDGTKCPAQGYGTYRLRINVPNKNEVYGLKIYSIFTAYNIYVNGELLSSMGTIGKSKIESIPKFGTQEISIPVLKHDSSKYQVLDIIIHASNYHHRRAGAQHPIFFGKMNAVVKATKDAIILNLFLIGIILIIGFNHILMYLIRRMDFANFIFGILSIIMILRSISTQERILLHWFPNMSWEFLVKLDNFSGFATMSLFAFFFYFTYRKDFPKVIFYILASLGVIVTILVFSTKAWFYGQFRLLFEAYIGLGGLYLVFGVLLTALFRKREGSTLSFIGMFLLYSTAVNDVLSSMGVIDSVYIAQYGIAAFMVIQSFQLTRKSAWALKDNQNLSMELNQEKLKLEERIEERTQKLAHQAEELESYKEDQEKQNRINEGLNQITEVMRLNKDNFTALADQLLATLIKRINASMGAMYLHTKINNEDKLKLIAHFGLSKEAQNEILDINEGLTGQCFSVGKATFIDDVPEKYFSISSGLGSSTPNILALIPMKIDEDVIGVVELASFMLISETHKKFLFRAIENIASQLNIVKLNDESQILIKESRRMTEETEAKNQEMMENLEELKAVQEESQKKEDEINKLLEDAKKREIEIESKLIESNKNQTICQDKLEKALYEIKALKSKSNKKTK